MRPVTATTELLVGPGPNPAPVLLVEIVDAPHDVLKEIYRQERSAALSCCQVCPVWWPEWSDELGEPGERIKVCPNHSFRDHSRLPKNVFLRRWLLGHRTQAFVQAVQEAKSLCVGEGLGELSCILGSGCPPPNLAAHGVSIDGPEVDILAGWLRAMQKSQHPTADRERALVGVAACQCQGNTEPTKADVTAALVELGLLLGVRDATWTKLEADGALQSAGGTVALCLLGALLPEREPVGVAS